MPRRRPGAVRAARRLEERRLPDWARDFPPIDRLSLETSAAIRFAEHSGAGEHLQPGGTAQFLRSYRAFLRRPGRTLRLIASQCPACPGCQYDDVAVVRDALGDVVRVLPPRARTELREVLTVLDTEFRRRTLPDPDPAHWTDWSGRPYAWWHRRLYEGD
ncbi:hypothetical protein AB0D57_40740 [Streptomyces sp. NPDC048275]|uniref:hypothetical protein n=1 Tax=Streptomyces sp. NPDC048275 TaxID=3155629 RepID=UPI0033F1013F